MFRAITSVKVPSRHCAQAKISSSSYTQLLPVVYQPTKEEAASVLLLSVSNFRVGFLRSFYLFGNTKMMVAQKFLQLSFLLVTISYVVTVPLDVSAKEREIVRLSNQVQHLTQELVNCKNNFDDKFNLYRRHFDDKNVTCNDGTTAGYYLKRSYESKKWIIFLEGGLYCFNDESCAARMNSSMRTLMTSSYWPSKMAGNGILSADIHVNPDWWNVNHVLVPYCSSDAWSGNVSMLESGGTFSFMGYRIINEVIKELLPLGLVDAEDLLFTGSSAGGIGVLMNIDRVAEMMLAAGSSAKVRGISDSGWYLEGKNAYLAQCRNNPKNCDRPSDIIIKGMGYWKGVVPEKCAEQFPGHYWRCYFGHNIYQTLKSPLFIFQWQYDLTQMIAENPGTGLKRGRDMIKRIFKLAADMKQSLKDQLVSDAFLPSCVSHSVLTKNDWRSIKVNSYSLNVAIFCWLMKDSNNSSLSTGMPMNGCPPRVAIDSCTYPQCNKCCPNVRDPITGKTVDLSKIIPMAPIPININPPSLKNIPPGQKDWNS